MMNRKLTNALAAFTALHEAFQGTNEILINHRQISLRSLMRELDSAEWDAYLEATTVLSQRWASEERIQGKIKKYEKGKESSNVA